MRHAALRKRGITGALDGAVNRPGIAWSQDGKVNYVVPLDPGIADVVEALRAKGVQTCESCQGGRGHSYREPTVVFAGDRGEGFRALGVALSLGFPVRHLRRVWAVVDGELWGRPVWHITFRR